MVRIAGVNLPKEKRIEAGLTAIYGIGRRLSTQILEEAKIDKNKKVDTLSEEEVSVLREIISKLATEGDLKRQITLNIKHHTETGTWRGLRHKKKLPVRGQITKSNARTRKGKKKTVANKKTVTK